MPAITANYIAYMIESKKLGARRNDAEKEMVRQELKKTLLETFAQDLDVDNKRGGNQVKALITGGRAFFNQDEYLKNFTNAQITAGEHLELLKEIGQRVKEIKTEMEAYSKNNTFLYQQFTEFILPILATPGADSQIIVTKLSRTDLLLRPEPQPAPIEIQPEPMPVPEPPKKKSFFDWLMGLFRKPKQPQ